MTQVTGETGQMVDQLASMPDPIGRGYLTEALGAFACPEEAMIVGLAVDPIVAYETRYGLAQRFATFTATI